MYFIEIKENVLGQIREMNISKMVMEENSTVTLERLFLNI